jgi:hypothetical protein
MIGQYKERCKGESEIKLLSIPLSTAVWWSEQGVSVSCLLIGIQTNAHSYTVW